MSTAGGEEHQFPGRFLVDRCDDRDVRKVRSTAIGVIRNEDIARLQCWIVLNDATNRLTHGAEMDGNVWCIHNQFTLGREDATGKIQTFLDVRRQARLLQRDPHLFGDGGEQMVEDFDADGIRCRRFLREGERLSIDWHFT